MGPNPNNGVSQSVTRFPFNIRGSGFLDKLTFLCGFENLYEMTACRKRGNGQNGLDYKVPFPFNYRSSVRLNKLGPATLASNRAA